MVSDSWWDGDGEPGACLCGSALGGARGGMRKQTHANNPARTFWELVGAPSAARGVGLLSLSMSP